MIQNLERQLQALPTKHHITATDFLVAVAQSLMLLVPDLEKQQPLTDFAKRSAEFVKEHTAIRALMVEEASKGRQ